MKGKKQFLIPLFFVLASSLFGDLFTVKAVSRKDFVSLSLILDDDYGYEDLATRLTALDFHNFTFAILWGGESPNYWGSNATRREFLLSYGSLIPDLPYLQTYSVTDRISFVYGTFDVWHYWFGEYPRGYMSFEPDTYISQYVYDTYNCTYVQGSCFDQYTIDFMTQRGGWQLPYYASDGHILKPSDAESILVFPHVTWDWLDSFTIAHYYNTHIQNLMVVFDDDEPQAKDYFLNLIDRSVTASSPFGFVSIQWEWCGMLTYFSLQDYAFEWFSTVLANPLYTFWNYEKIAEWFNTNYDRTPVYRVAFTSPFSDTNVEWYYDIQKRVCRYDGKVMSYVDYRTPDIDKYRMISQSINWGEGWLNNPDNCIDYSLYNCTKIDALGGGYLRFEGFGEGQAYSGDLADFTGIVPSLMWYEDPLKFIAIIGVAFASLYVLYWLAK